MPIIKSISEFDFAYQGYQYPVPPSWKYLIRQQDQINWLYNALAHLNANGMNTDELTTKLNDLRVELMDAISEGDANQQNYTDAQIGALEQQLSTKIADLQEQIINIVAGKALWTNPITGLIATGERIDRALYDVARPYGATYEQVQTYYVNDDYETADAAFSLNTYMQVDVLIAAISGMIAVDATTLAWFEKQAAYMPIAH